MPEENQKTPMETAEEIASEGVQSVSFGGRTVTKVSVNDLIALDKHKRATASEDMGIQELRVAPGSTRW